MNGRVLCSSFIILVLAALCGCNGIDKLPGTGSSGGALTVQVTQGPPASVIAGQSFGLVANVANDSKNGGVTWSCSPSSACGSFTPSTTGYQIGTLYTPPVAPPNGPVEPNLAYSVTVTATSVTDTSQSASVTFNVAQQYAFVLPGGFGGWGLAGSVTLDGLGNVLGGEVDAVSPGFYTLFTIIPTSTSGSGSFYSLDATGHGILSLDFTGTGTTSDVEAHGITATSNSHLVIAEEDQFNGYSYGNTGSMDLQTAGPAFSGSQVTGGYSFTLSGYDGAMSENSSWGGIFTADGTATSTNPGNITSGIFDVNAGNDGGGSGYNGELAPGQQLAGLPFTGTYTAPDANGRGVISLNAVPFANSPCGGTGQPSCTESAQYAYYLVTPEVLRLVLITNTGSIGNAGSAFGQGSLSTAANDTTAALNGGYVFTYFGFGDNNNGGDSDAAAGQFSTNGSGAIETGILDTNVADGGTGVALGVVTTDISLAGGTIAVSGSPRATLTLPSGQVFNVYLTDPNLNLLDPNNTTGTGGALLFEANNNTATYGNAVGVMIPQSSPAPTALSGSYAILFGQESNPGGCCNSDGGYTGDFTVSATADTFSGEGDFQGSGTDAAGQCCSTLGTNPLTGTFTADASNPGHFSGTITTTPAFPMGPVGGTTPGTLDVDFFVANSSQGFLVETDAVAPTFGVIEAQGTIDSGSQKRQRALQRDAFPMTKTSSQPATTTKQFETSRRSR
jgi:hypothetical protein